MEWWRVFIPVIWAIVSTLIGLVLYKTSEAFFETRHRQDRNSRTIRLVGSAAIAGFAFFGLKWSTPEYMLRGYSHDHLSILLDETRSALVNLEGCASISPPSECKPDISALRQRIDSTRNYVKGLTK
jgi:hypothetical protein